jgi:hypothetical protein
MPPRPALSGILSFTCRNRPTDLPRPGGARRTARGVQMKEDHDLAFHCVVMIQPYKDFSIFNMLSMRGVELMEDWDLCTRMQTSNKIAPLR